MRFEIVAGTLAACLLSASADAQGTPSGAITAVTNAQYGDYLADAGGRALYVYTGDGQGASDYDARSMCQDACTRTWSPFVVRTAPKAEAKVDASMIATMARIDGRTQVTYHGWPLYYFAQDANAGATNGQAQHDARGDWYLVDPSGTPIRK